MLFVGAAVEQALLVAAALRQVNDGKGQQHGDGCQHDDKNDVYHIH